MERESIIGIAIRSYLICRRGPKEDDSFAAKHGLKYYLYLFYLPMEAKLIFPD